MDAASSTLYFCRSVSSHRASQAAILPSPLYLGGGGRFGKNVAARGST